MNKKVTSILIILFITYSPLAIAQSCSEWTDTGTVLYPTDSNGTLDNVIIGGTTTTGSDIFLGVDGSAIFNQQGNDSDFRIDGDNVENLFFVNAQFGRVGIGTSTPVSHLDVRGNIRTGLDGTGGEMILAAISNGPTGASLHLNAAGLNDDWQIDINNSTMRIFSSSSNNNQLEISNFGSGISDLSVEGSVISNALTVSGSSTISGSLVVDSYVSGDFFSVKGKGVAHFMIDEDGHIDTGGTAPTFSDCGTSPSITGNDIAGRITAGTDSPSDCTITFSTAYNNAPACTVSGDGLSGTVAYTASGNTLRLTIGSDFGDLGGDVIMYICMEP